VSEFGCKTFPLSVCRRCPKSHIRLAQAIVPDIKWCEKDRDGIDAPEGEIYQLIADEAIEMMQPGDLGLSRVNRVLIAVAYALIKAKKKVVIRGHDFGQGLISFIKKLKPNSIEDLIYKAQRYEVEEMAKIAKAENIAFESDGDFVITKDTIARLSRKNQRKMEAILDKTGCIVALCDGVTDIATLIKNVNEIFSDFDDEGKPKDAVVLGTVHRTKGLEAHNVYMIDPENFPHQMASKSWEVQQERNLAYVGVTRAKFQLDSNGNVVQPGRLIFFGSCPAIFKAEWLMGHAVYPKPQQPTEVTPEPIKEEPVIVVPVKSEIDLMREKLVAVYVKMGTPQDAATAMIGNMSEKHVRQCATVML
jgi:hypothetical protein